MNPPIHIYIYMYVSDEKLPIWKGLHCRIFICIIIIFLKCILILLREHDSLLAIKNKCARGIVLRIYFTTNKLHSLKFAARIRLATIFVKIESKQLFTKKIQLFTKFQLFLYILSRIFIINLPQFLLIK